MRTEAKKKLRFYIKRQMGWFDIDEINKYYKKKLAVYRERFEKYYQSYSAIRMRVEKFKYISFMDANSVIVAMIKRSA